MIIWRCVPRDVESLARGEVDKSFGFAARFDCRDLFCRELSQSAAATARIDVGLLLAFDDVIARNPPVSAVELDFRAILCFLRRR